MCTLKVFLRLFINAEGRIYQIPHFLGDFMTGCACVKVSEPARVPF